MKITGCTFSIIIFSITNYFKILGGCPRKYTFSKTPPLKKFSPAACWKHMKPQFFSAPAAPKNGGAPAARPHFPISPWGAPAARNFSSFFPWGAPAARNFFFIFALGRACGAQSSFIFPWGAAGTTFFRSQQQLILGRGLGGKETTFFFIPTTINSGRAAGNENNWQKPVFFSI